jgi:hypothetical protein
LEAIWNVFRTISERFQRTFRYLLNTKKLEAECHSDVMKSGRVLLTENNVELFHGSIGIEHLYNRISSGFIYCVEYE